MSALILAGDVGGTKTHLALYRAGDGAGAALDDRVFATADFPSLESACERFLAGASADVACFGVAGPVIGGRAHATNVPWLMDEAALASGLKIARVRLINDLEATAYGMLYLGESQVAVLQRGERPPQGANAAVIAAGTGLGEAILVSEGASWRALASEGGHCGFAPRGEEQIGLLRFLAAEFGHVSFERVLSGPGLVNIYRYLKQSMTGAEPQWLAERLKAEDPAAVISQAALQEHDPRCVHALELFVTIYGAEAANLALKTLALGGVYAAGGIAPKILPMLEQGQFIRAFLDMGRLEELLRKIEVRVSLDPAAALSGARHVARALL